MRHDLIMHRYCTLPLRLGLLNHDQGRTVADANIAAVALLEIDKTDKKPKEFYSV